MVVTRRQAAARRDSLSSAENGAPDSVSAASAPSLDNQPDDAVDVDEQVHKYKPKSAPESQAVTASASASVSASASGSSTTTGRSASKKWGIDFWKRLGSGLVLSGLFAALINSGHIWVCIGVILMEVSCL